MKQYKIVSNEKIAKGAYILSFNRDFYFIPGQVIKLTADEHIAPRMYSICSGSNDSLIQILYSVRPQGELTPKLSALKSGQTIWASQPLGNFVAGIEPACWIAAGTGIAPFVSMLKSDNYNCWLVLHGARNEDGFYFKDYFKSSLGANYVQCSSGQQIENVFSGRVTNFLQQLMSLPPVEKYYLCGSAEMVVETRDILISKGVPFDSILSEIYF